MARHAAVAMTGKPNWKKKWLAISHLLHYCTVSSHGVGDGDIYKYKKSAIALRYHEMAYVTSPGYFETGRKEKI